MEQEFPGGVRHRRLRPGLWLHWGPAFLATASCLLPDGIAAGALHFVFFVEGLWQETYHAADASAAIAPGTMALLRADALHGCIAQSAPAHHATITASARAWQDLLTDDDSPGARTVRAMAEASAPPQVALPLTPAARFAAESIRRCPFAGVSRGLALEARANDMLAELITGLNSAEAPAAPVILQDTEEQIRTAARLLVHDLENPPSLAKLARAAGLSESTLKRGFGQVFGTTPFGYLRSRRMEHARQLLAQGAATVLEAAAAVGYSNPSNFAAAFRRQFGVNPKVFQRTAGR